MSKVTLSKDIKTVVILTSEGTLIHPDWLDTHNRTTEEILKDARKQVSVEYRAWFENEADSEAPVSSFQYIEIMVKADQSGDYPFRQRFDPACVPVCHCGLAKIDHLTVSSHAFEKTDISRQKDYQDVIGLALKLHSHNCGEGVLDLMPSETMLLPMPSKVKRGALSTLHARLLNWKPSHKSSVRFDEAVRELLMAAVSETALADLEAQEKVKETARDALGNFEPRKARE